jgi:histone H1/5
LTNKTHQAPAVVEVEKVLGKTKSGRVTKGPPKPAAPAKKAATKQTATPKKAATPKKKAEAST